MRCCQNKTSFSWSYWDLSKRSFENNVISRRGREKYTHFEIGEHVQMAKSDPEAQRKSSLSDCTWLENEYGSFNLESLKSLMHFREPGKFTLLLYFYELIYIFFFSHTYFFFIFFSLYSFFIFYFFLLSSFFICSPWTLNCIVPTSSPMLRRLLVPGQRGDRDKVGNRNIFPFERYLKSSTLAPSCDLPWIDDLYSYDRLWSRR
jgi:hypothetical protein